jgi:5-methylcytosine-specific restriction endonuclease McrA
MIYAYKHLVHRIEDFHSNIAYFFEQLFVTNPPAYDETILFRPTFVPIVNRSRVSLRDNLRAITQAYYALTPAEKLEVQRAFQANSNVQQLCSDTTTIPVKFEGIPASIRTLLKDFLTMLWETYPQNELLENACGTVQEHFTAFVSSTHQQALICPFCGLNKLKTSESVNRDAYDHYIPKAFYPFISINFQNLFPICHECNSDEKKTTDTLYNGGVRRPVFFPLDITYDNSQLWVKVVPEQTYNPDNLKTLLYDISWHYEIMLSGNSDPRLTAWDEIFHIKRRYKENILVYQNEWYAEVVRRYRRESAKGTPFKDFRDEIISDAEYMKLISPFGLLRLSYFHFLFSIQDIEVKLGKSI